MFWNNKNGQFQPWIIIPNTLSLHLYNMEILQRKYITGILHSENISYAGGQNMCKKRKNNSKYGCAKYVWSIILMLVISLELSY